MSNSAVSPTEETTAKRTLGRYELYDEIGRGATAVVFRAFDPRIKRMIAIKVLRDELARNDDYRRRFLAEARFAGTLTHPHIMTVFDVGEANGKPFMAMELLDGPTLEQVARARPLSTEQILRIGVYLADALSYAHAAGVIHRDIKPDNIICTDHQGSVKLMDFGIAQLHRPGQVGEANSIIAGTPKYMSPEQMAGNHVDGRSDLYSLGVVLYRLATGHPPYSAASIGELFEQVNDGPEPTLKPINSSMPAPLVELIRALMRKNPEDRYQDGREVLEDLRQIEFDFLERQRSWAGRTIVPLRIRWTVVVSLLVALTMVAGLFLVYERQNEAMENLALDFGATVTRIVASETAEDLLLGDAIAIQTTVNSMQRNREMVYMSVADHRDSVLASTDASLIDKPLNSGAMEASLQQHEEFVVWRDSDADNQPIFRFFAPIRYQDQRIGSLELGLSRSTLDAASHTTLITLITVLLVTLLAVFTSVYALTRRLSSPMEQLRRSMGKLTAGDFSSRIRINRRDEFARLFNAFNLMAESLQSRAESEGRLPDVVPSAQSDKPRGDTEDISMDETIVDPTFPRERKGGAD